MRVIAILSCILLGLSASAQIRDPVKWTWVAKKVNATAYEIRITAILDKGWHIYSQTTPSGGPVRTTISFEKNPLLLVQGQPKEIGKLEQRHEELFGVDVKQYAGKVEFVQLIKLKAAIKTKLNGAIEFMVCNDHECLPPKTVSFSLPIN